MNDLKYISGDLVLYASLIKEPVAEICEVHEASYTVKFMHGNFAKVTSKEIKPITLTLKILEKNGWEYYSSDGNERIYTKEFKDMSIYIGVDKDSKAMYVYNGINDYGCADDYYLRSVGYVHQLQHFLFGLGLNSEMEV